MRGRGSNPKSRKNLLPGGNKFNQKIWFVYKADADGNGIKVEGPFNFNKAYFVSTGLSGRDRGVYWVAE